MYHNAVFREDSLLQQAYLAAFLLSPRMAEIQMADAQWLVGP